MIEKIISGGQTGADFAGLMAARFLGIPTGGTAPKGWRIENADGSSGSNPELASFGLIEHESSEYPPRTKQNVADSDATLWMGYEASPGGRLTIATCEKLDKPIAINPSIEAFRAFLKNCDVKVLNIAGSRESSFNPGIYDLVYQFLVEALTEGEDEPETEGLEVE